MLRDNDIGKDPEWVKIASSFNFDPKAMALAIRSKQKLIDRLAEKLKRAENERLQLIRQYEPETVAT